MSDPTRRDSDLSRVALERVLARASELQSTTQVDASDAISESRLLEIAKEVGLDADHVRQAIAEERAQLPMTDSSAGPVLSALGVARLGAQRTVSGTPAELLTRLEALLPKQELLLLVRRAGDRIILEPRRDPLGNLFRAMGAGGRRFDLVRADTLVVSATAVDGARSVLRLDLDLSGARRMDRTTVITVASLLVLAAIVPTAARGSPGAGCVSATAPC
jgi:hypothetical protein